jgi:hypothetical protein
MNRSLIMVGIMAIGTALYSGSASRHADLTGQLNEAKTDLDTIVKRVGSAERSEARVRAELRSINDQVHVARSAIPVSESALSLALTQGVDPKSDTLSRAALEVLGIEWDSSSEYIMVPKGVLAHLSMDGLDTNGVLSDAVAGVLNLNSGERVEVQAALNETWASYRSWLISSAKRAPIEEVRAVSWRIPADPESAQTLVESLSSSLTASIGADRSRLLLRYTKDAIDASYAGLGKTLAVLTVYPPPDSAKGTPLFSYETFAGGNRSLDNDSIFPIGSRPMPPVFRQLFPGGWAELLAREGIALPIRQ